MIAHFDLEHVSRRVSSFNYDKLYWLNQHYQKSDSPESVAKALHWHFEQAGIDLTKGPELKDIVETQAERSKTLVEMLEMSRIFIPMLLIMMKMRLKNIYARLFWSL